MEIGILEPEGRENKIDRKPERSYTLYDQQVIRLVNPDKIWSRKWTRMIGMANWHAVVMDNTFI